jgi:hypothetical protein
MKIDAKHYMKYYTDHIHCNSKAAGAFIKELHFNGSNIENDESFKNIFTFFEKSFGRTNDIDAYVMVGKSLSRSEWSYRISKSGYTDHRIYMTAKALEYFNFWYNKPALKVA